MSYHVISCHHAQVVLASGTDLQGSQMRCTMMHLRQIRRELLKKDAKQREGKKDDETDETTGFEMAF